MKWIKYKSAGEKVCHIGTQQFPVKKGKSKEMVRSQGSHTHVSTEGGKVGGGDRIKERDLGFWGR